jgi:hypothetical protein
MQLTRGEYSVTIVLAAFAIARRRQQSIDGAARQAINSWVGVTWGLAGSAIR